MDYIEFLKRKAAIVPDRGLHTIPATWNGLFDFQKKTVDFALRKGCAALFLDTGLGKTPCQVEWARNQPHDCLLVAPLAVAQQTKRLSEEMFGVEMFHSRDGSKGGKLTITNYERLHHFDLSKFGAVVLDESSILKSFMGKTKNYLCDSFAHYPFRLACTATPAPNDYMEIGNHSDFLGIMPSNEMLSRWFINDTMNFGNYRLKGHAVKSFWEWVASWAACVSKPSDLGGDDKPFQLPELKTQLHVADSDIRAGANEDELFRASEISATNMHAEKRATLTERVALAKSLGNHSDPCIVWCESNAESAALAAAFGDDCVEVVGSDDADKKEASLDRFSRGQVRVIVTKPSIAGFGLNWQHCNHVVFASISYSYESFYQAIRRSWRFGQKRDVKCDVIISPLEDGIWRTIKAKLSAHDEMKNAMRFAVMESAKTYRIKEGYNPNKEGVLPPWIVTK